MVETVSPEDINLSAEPLEPIKRNKSILSRWLVFLGWAGMLIFTFHACTHMVAAGDTWVAMACGKHFINNGVDTVEPFSANSHEAGPTPKEVKTWPQWAQTLTDKVGIENVQKWHPTGWINQNWLTHVIFYWLSHESPFADATQRSFNTLVYWKFAIYIFGVICIYYTARLLGAHPYLASVFSCFAMFIGRSLIDVRPAGFSNVLVAAFLLVLVLATYRNILYIWLLVPLTVFWCNLHGGYIYAFIMMVPFIGLHVFIILPKKWTVCFYSIAMWMGLYLFVFRFLNKLSGTAEEVLRKPEVFPAPVLMEGGLFYFLIVFILVSIILTILTSLRKIKDNAFFGYHIIITIILSFAFLVKMFPEMPFALQVISSQVIKDRFQDMIFKSQIFYFVILLIMLALGYILIYQKKKFVSIGVKGIGHVIAASFVTFIAAIILNPFHLTNFTHTLIISFSKHAEMWRQVNEWHPAFEWTNPVGSAFPFLIMLVLSIAIAIYWLYCNVLVPKDEIAKNEMDARVKTNKILLRVFGWTAAFILCWITFISFSFVKADLISFLLCAAFTAIILLSIYKNVHFIYLSGLLVLIALALSTIGVDPENLVKLKSKVYEGRYIFAFVLVPSYLLIYVVASLFSKDLKYKRRDIVFPVLTAVVAIILMFVLFRDPQPLKLRVDFGQTGWLGELFSKLYGIVRTFKPLYEKNLDLTYKHLFKSLYLINALSILVWILLPDLKRFFTRIEDQRSEKGKVHYHPYKAIKIDLAYIIITALTIYMAVRSRRFMPIAGIAACSLMALFITQIAFAISTTINFNKFQRYMISEIPYKLEVFLAIAGTCVVLFFGTYWGLKFKTVYLDAWPTDPEYTSIFMRMTASDRKPFHAGDFIRENDLQGKMFNYWTEGGFIAWAQDPDPNSGKTQLQLFMDGRAQAAYDPKTYRLWSKIMSGGPTAVSVSMAKRSYTQADYKEMGKYISEVLRKRKVWLILMPVSKNTSKFVKSVETNKEWQIIFFNNKQKMFVDIRSENGRKLMEGVVTSETVYPDEFSRNLMFSNIYRRQKSETSIEIGFKHAMQAFQLNPSQIPLLEIVSYSKYPKLKPQIDDFCKQYFQEISENIDKYRYEDSYFNRITAAMLTVRYLEKAISSKENPQLFSSLANMKRALKIEQSKISKTKKW
ncbi:MAG: hypothetical protein ACYSTX_01685 [Planctomycetota bacterium]|jgi:hypothetical protein